MGDMRGNLVSLRANAGSAAGDGPLLQGRNVRRGGFRVDLSGRSTTQGEEQDGGLDRRRTRTFIKS